MSNDAYPSRTNEPAEYTTRIRITGTGAANPTNTLARGVTVTRVSAVGKYRITWTRRPGKTFTGGSFSFQATTPSELAGYTVVFGDYTASGSSFTLDFWVYDATPTLDDLEANWKLNLALTFKRTAA